jgi:uncharacterized protein
MRVYIVGMGPAGLCAYYKYKLLDNDVTIIDKGACDNVEFSGLGGAGLNSDGKFSLFPAGSTIQNFKHHCESIDIFNTLVDFHLPYPTSYSTPHMACIEIKRYTSIYKDLEYRRALVGRLCGDNSNMYFDTPFTGYTKRGDKFIINGEEYDKLIIATGKVPYFNAAVFSKFIKIEIGCRIESELLEKPYGLVDPKIKIQHMEHEFRTFCWSNISSPILCYNSWSGGNGDKKSVSINCRITDFAKCGILLGLDYTPKKYTYDEFCGIDHPFVKMLIHSIREMLDVTNGDIYWPVIEGYGSYPVVDEYFETSEKGLYVIGDGTGVGRGLVYSMLSGLSLT